ncbi:MAG: hypothetical protein ACI8P3_000021 [Saprospiraceae bacterium]|jgi:hypothetical protein
MTKPEELATLLARCRRMDESHGNRKSVKKGSHKVIHILLCGLAPLWQKKESNSPLFMLMIHLGNNSPTTIKFQ